MGGMVRGLPGPPGGAVRWATAAVVRTGRPEWTPCPGGVRRPGPAYIARVSPAAAGSVRNMSWSKYGEFLAFAVVLIVIPGPDFAVITKNTLVGGRRRGRWTAFGVSSSNLVQGTAAAFGLSALIVKVQPV